MKRKYADEIIERLECIKGGAWASSEIINAKDHWIDLGDGEYKCPKCSREFIFGLDIKSFTESFPSCPKCGVKMEV